MRDCSGVEFATFHASGALLGPRANGLNARPVRVRRAHRHKSDSTSRGSSGADDRHRAIAFMEWADGPRRAEPLLATPPVFGWLAAEPHAGRTTWNLEQLSPARRLRVSAAFCARAARRGAVRIGHSRHGSVPGV